jgi:hypothetical protein
VITPRGATIYTKVSDLIDPVTETWDEPLLRSLMSVVDVERILEIPINHKGFDDFLAWNHTSHGSYTVHSGYHLQWKHQFGASAGQLALPGGSTNNLVWKTLWHLKLPSKVKIFNWRSLHGIVPLKCIIANRHIGTSASCPICNQDLKTCKICSFNAP